MTIVDTDAPLRFLRTAYEPDDWIALFLKSYETGRTAQRVGPLSLFLEARLHRWLRAMNAHRFNVYVSVNAIRAGVRGRTKDAIGAVRHLFLEADDDGAGVLARLAKRDDLPPPSYVLESSPNRVHIFWRVAGFTTVAIETLQKHFAAEFATDPAATACTQTTRLPGYLNHKYTPGYLVRVEYYKSQVRHASEDFPRPPDAPERARFGRTVGPSMMDVVERARRYLASVKPAVAGRHGDLHTFRVCCRIARGFDLDDEEALAALRAWNAQCQPPWSERELRAKISNARKYRPRASQGATLSAAQQRRNLNRRL